MDSVNGRRRHSLPKPWLFGGLVRGHRGGRRGVGPGRVLWGSLRPSAPLMVQFPRCVWRCHRRCDVYNICAG